MNTTIRSKLSDTMTMVSRCMKHTTRHVDILIMTAILPLMQLLLLVFVFGGAMNTGDINYIDYVLPGILLMSIGSCASMAATSVKEDLSKGIMNRFRAMDIDRSAVLNGHMVATLARSAITAVIVIGVSVLLGFRTGMGLTDYLVAFIIVFLYTLAYTWGAILWGLCAPSVEGASLISFLGMLLPYLSSSFVPLETMPKALQAVAQYQPFTPLAESLRGLFLGTDSGNSIWIAIAWCAGILVVCYINAIRVYKKKAK